MIIYILTTYPCYRMDHINALADQLPLHWTVELVCGPNIKRLGDDWEQGCPDFRGFDDWRSPSKGKGTIACGQGHLDIWNRFLSTNQQDCLVLEDDVTIQCGPDALRAAFIALPMGYDWALPQHAVLPNPVEEHFPVRHNKHWRIGKDHHTGSMAYWISRKGATYLRSIYTPICATPDHIMVIGSQERNCYVSDVELIKHDFKTESLIGLDH